MQDFFKPAAFENAAGFHDKYNRVINYLRISLTDRCNLRCIYCMPKGGVNYIPHREILTYEEILYVVNLCAAHGIKKVRLTGGEPLVRKGIIGFIEKLTQIDGLEEISLTTNGVLLKEFARPLMESGITRLNVSMDTLIPEKYHRITRRDLFYKVWEGIEEAESAGFSPIKLNVVAMKGINDMEISDFARLTYKKPYHIRFIEMMPLGEKNIWSPDTMLSIDEIISTITGLGTLKPVGSSVLDGPAQRYKLDEALGEIGFIGAISHSFCKTCNRIRLTADGSLRGCLFSDKETDIKTPLRKGKDDNYLLNLISNTIFNKPANHGMISSHETKSLRTMNSIGG